MKDDKKGHTKEVAKRMIADLSKEFSSFGVTAKEAASAFATLGDGLPEVNKKIAKGLSLPKTGPREHVGRAAKSLGVKLPSTAPLMKRKHVEVREIANTYKIRDGDIRLNPIGRDAELERVRKELEDGIRIYLEENNLVAVGVIKHELDREIHTGSYIINVLQGYAERDGLTKGEIEHLGKIRSHVPKGPISIPELPCGTPPTSYPIHTAAAFYSDGDVTLDVGHGEARICGTSDLKKLKNKRRKPENKSFDNVEDLRAWMRKGCPMKGNENEDEK